MSDTQLCKNCKQKIESSKFFLHERMCKINIKRCPKCNEPFTAEDLDEHMQEYHSEVKCDLCEKNFEQNKIDAHKLNCECRKVLCNYCELELPYKDLYAHQYVCGSKTEQCATCKTMVQKKNWERHLLYDCKNIVEKQKQNSIKENKTNNNNINMKVQVKTENNNVQNKINKIADNKINKIVDNNNKITELGAFNNRKQIQYNNNINSINNKNITNKNLTNKPEIPKIDKKENPKKLNTNQLKAPIKGKLFLKGPKGQLLSNNTNQINEKKEIKKPITNPLVKKEGEKRVISPFNNNARPPSSKVPFNINKGKMNAYNIEHKKKVSDLKDPLRESKDNFKFKPNINDKIKMNKINNAPLKKIDNDFVNDFYNCDAQNLDDDEAMLQAVIQESLKK